MGITHCEPAAAEEEDDDYGEENSTHMQHGKQIIMNDLLGMGIIDWSLIIGGLFLGSRFDFRQYSHLREDKCLTPTEERTKNGDLLEVVVLHFIGLS